MQTADLDNGYDTLAVDLGNHNARIKGTRGSVIKPQGITQITEAQFSQARHYTPKGAEYELLQWRNEFYAVGASAFVFEPNLVPALGRLKWKRDNYGIQLAGLILEYYKGNPPANLNVVLAHPPGDYAMTPELLKSVLKGWKISTPKVNFSYTIEQAALTPEVVGGVMNYTLDEENNRLADARAGALLGLTLVVDLGGGTLDYCVLENGVIDWRRVASERIGLNRAVEDFKDLMAEQHSELFKLTEDGRPTSDIARRVFMSPDKKHAAMGKQWDCSNIYAQALAPIARQVADSVKRFGNLGEFNGILLMGGGTAAVIDLLINKGGVFHAFDQNGAVILAAPRPKLHTAQVDGIYKTIPSLIAESVRQKRLANKKEGRNAR